MKNTYYEICKCGKEMMSQAILEEYIKKHLEIARGLNRCMFSGHEYPGNTKCPNKFGEHCVWCGVYAERPEEEKEHKEFVDLITP